MNTKLLRQKILDLAIRGKLTDQRKSDGTAADLLKEIAAESPSLRPSKRGSNPQQKEITPLDKSEAPFEIPDNWEWVKLGDFLDVRDGTHDSPKYVEKGYPFVTSKNLVDGRIDFSTCKQISKSDYDKFNERSHVDDGDILYAMIGSIGNAVLVKKDRDFAIKNVALFKKKNSQTNMGYVYYWLCFIEKTLKGNAAGGLQPFISLSMFREQAFPLPPLAEQQRIVAKIEEAFAEIDAVENNKELLKTHIKQTRQKILDLAIHGKLVPQDENDEPASVLLEKILQEKAQTDNKKSSKKKKTDDIATSDNRPYEKVTVDGEPFEIPSLWEWVKLGNVCNPIKRGKSPKYAEKSNVLVFAQKCNQKNGPISLEKALYLDETTLSKYPQDEFLQMGDVVINSTGTGTLGRVGFFNEALPHDIKGIVPDSHVTTIRSSVVNSRYLYYFLKNRQPYLEENGEGSTNQKELKPHTIYDLEFPFPPLAEQKRIVDKIEEIFKSLDEISLHLV